MSGISADSIVPISSARRSGKAGLSVVDGGADNLTQGDILSEDAAALAFARLYSERVRFDPDRSKWLVWDGNCWRIDGVHLAFAWVRQTVREYAEQHAKGERDKAKLGSSSFARGVEFFARAEQELVAPFASWNSDPDLLGTPQGVVNLRTGLLMQPDPAQLISQQTAIVPSEHEDCPRWLQFLTEATGGDPELIRFLQLWAGYSLTGCINEHTLIFIHGDGGNGKSVFTNTLQFVAGDYASTAQMSTFVSKAFDRGDEDVAALRSARLVTASETSEGRAWDEARIKSLTGGDRISARALYENPISFLPRFKLQFLGNHAPTIQNLDNAMRRRFLIVPFTRTPAEPDTQLEDKLKAEAPGILRWAINGAGAWYISGLPRPEAVTKATAEYFSEQDIVGAWLEDCCRVEPANEFLSASTVELFQSFKRYAESRGEDCGSQTKFNRAMARKGFEKKQIKALKTKGFYGVQLKAPETGY